MDRDVWEARLARALGRVHQEQLERLLEALGDPPDLNNLPVNVWREFEEALFNVIKPLLEQIYVEAAQEMLATTSVGVDWALVNANAAEWARTYAFDLVRGINDNSRAALQKQIAGFFGKPTNMEDLRKALQSTYGPVRAAMIAVTETTRASVQGELALAKELRDQGMNLITVWNTSNDSLTCPICAPRNGKKQGDGWELPPPAHVKCRCTVSHELVVA